VTTISILGGGRWARTIATVLGSVMPRSSDRIVVHSTHNAPSIAAMIEERGLRNRVRLSASTLDLFSGPERPDAAIIANRALDHFAAASQALIAGVPVLVEKPMALPRGKIMRLCEFADKNGTLLAASNVFLFARYFSEFTEHVAAAGRPRHLRFTWTDGPAEIRHGELKNYDPSVTLFDDVLPHVVPMLRVLLANSLSLTSIDVRRGGAEITVEAQSEGATASLVLARNGVGRQRRIEIELDHGPCSLDFSVEPGLIRSRGAEWNGDPLWSSQPRPLASMLKAFLSAVAGGPLDPRLSPATTALPGANLADAVRIPYLAHQIRWLEGQLGKTMNEPLTYTVRELAGDAASSESDVLSQLWSAIDSSTRLQAFFLKSHQLSLRD
jgi:predicted dehydrogenase